MISYGVILGLLSSFFKSSKSVTTKIASTDTNEYVTSFSTRFFSIPVFIIGLIITDSFVLTYSDTFVQALTINSLSMVATTILIAKSLKISDISVISPLLAFVPVFVTVPSYLLLGEVPSNLAGFGIISVTVGAYVLNTSDSDSGYLEPIKRVASDRGAQYISIVLLIVSVTPSIDKIGIQETSPLTWILSTHITASVVLLVVALLTSSSISEPLRNNIKILLLVGLSSSMIWVFQSYGYTLTQVSYIQALKRVSLVFSVVAGKFIFEEDNIRRRLISSLIILVGVLAIILGS